jgi:hypothetical protein
MYRYIHLNEFVWIRVNCGVRRCAVCGVRCAAFQFMQCAAAVRKFAAVHAVVCGSACGSVQLSRSARGIVRLSSSAVLTGSARGCVRQCARMCAAVHVSVCGSAFGNVWQCLRHCAAVQQCAGQFAAVCGSAAVRQRAAVWQGGSVHTFKSKSKYIRTDLYECGINQRIWNKSNKIK